MYENFNKKLLQNFLKKQKFEVFFYDNFNKNKVKKTNFKKLYKFPLRQNKIVCTSEEISVICSFHKEMRIKLINKNSERK